MTGGILLSALTLGFVLGLKHALDPDHMVAVSTIVSESQSIKRSSLVGTLWGLGHTLSLLCAGVLVIALKIGVSDRAALWMEFAMALMLILLGLKAILKSLSGWKLHRHRHTHDGSTHMHLHLHRGGDERVGHLHASRRIRDAIDGALVVRDPVIDRRRHHLLRQGEVVDWIVGKSNHREFQAE